MRILFLLVALLLAPLALASGVDVNTAPAGDLETLPGIGPAKAAAIVEHRQAQGPFTSVDALDDVPGIGPATLANIRDQVTVGDASQAAPGPSQPDASPSGSEGRVNVNTAPASELERLPGIGPTKATAIIEDRETNGAYASCEDLARVKGIGSATVASVRDLCTAE